MVVIVIFIIRKRGKTIETNEEDAESNHTPIKIRKHDKPNLSLLLRLSFILAEEGIYSKSLVKQAPVFESESKCDRKEKEENSFLSKSSVRESLNDAFCSENHIKATPSGKHMEEKNILVFSPVSVENNNNDDYVIMKKQRWSILMSDNIVCYQ